MALIEDFRSGVLAPARTLPDVFGATVERFGDRVSLRADDGSLTYRELADAAVALARSLRSLGVGPGERVGVRVPSGSADLYVAILAVLGAGAAYVPVDADDPPERAAWIWQRADVCAVVEAGLVVRSLRAARGAARDVEPDDDAWIIFTSGSTGEPKGVAVTHRSAAAFVEAEARLFTVGADDRVLAGLSVAFDASCEEMWLAWRNGAALVPAPRAIVRSGCELGRWIAARGVTVVSTVPTLASLWDDDVLAGVRLLILGGEACSQALAERVSGRGCEVWNTYGPTEATVVTTAGRIEPGRPVTIGWPLHGWMTAVVDEQGEPVPFGEPGELAIGGVGLGRYLDPALDAERFVPLPALGWERAYRTGDVVRETTGGLEFVGRRDDQVKLAGRRIELGEVDALLRAAPGVRAAAAAVRRSDAGNPVLVGYVVGEVDPARVREHVASRLPAGLAPLVVVLDSLPLSPSGKTDRAALPWPPPAESSAAELSGIAAWLASRWCEQLGPLPLALESDFFELGGSSVAAAKLVSVVRQRFPSVAVADVYEYRRLGELAARLEEVGEGGDRGVVERSVPRRRWGTLQLFGVLALIAFGAPAWLGAIFAYDDWQHTGPQLAWPWLVGGWLVFLSAPGRGLIAVAARRLLLPRLAPGRYPRRGWIACRVWFVERLAEVLHLGRLAGTPWAAKYARLFGARIGSGVRLGTLPSPVALISIDDGATIEASVDAHGWWIEGDEMVVGEIRVGAGARVGARSVLMPGAAIGADAEVEPGSVVSGEVPAGERWEGSPARRVGVAGAWWPAVAPPHEPGRRAWKWMYAGGLVGLNLLTLVAALPDLGVLQLLGAVWRSPGGTVATLLAASPLLAATFVVSDAVLSALVFRCVSRLVRPGWHNDQGGAAWALWFCDQLMDVGRQVLFPLYATIYTRAWLRLHGIDVGRRSEVSTAEGLNKLVRLGETSFVADAPMFAGAQGHRGWLHVGPIDVGDRTFVGNGALLTGGTRLGDECLVGIESTAPRRCDDGTSWFGSPPIELPRVPDRPDPARTTHPPRRLVLARGATELVRILLPGTVSIVLGGLVFLSLERIGAHAGSGLMIAAAPLVLAAASICAALFTIAVKWIAIGRYAPGERPLWSFFVWRDEIVNSCQEQLAGDWLLDKALGTPLMRPYLRAMGARVGSDVWCETLAITEFDVVTVRDGCAINRGACLETHLFHDRLMRIGPTDLGPGSTLGPVSAVLPDTKLGAGCSVGGRSVVMRGEELPSGTRWHGAPVVTV